MKHRETEQRRGEDIEKLLGRYFAPVVSVHAPPRLAACAFEGREVLAVFSAGFSPREDPLRAAYRIASQTKSFASAAALKLRDSGRLGLEDPVSKFLPALEPREQWDRVTVAQLMSMESGLPHGDDDWADPLVECADDEMDEILSRPFSFTSAPGAGYQYSNLGYMVLGRLLSRAAGESILRYIEREFLEPLEMNHSGWNDIRSDTAVFGGLTSTIEDMIRWINFLIENGSEQAARHPELTPDKAVLGSRERGWYCYGLRSYEQNGMSTVGHSGGLPGWGSHMRWRVQRPLGVIAWADKTYCPVWDACRDFLTAEYFE